MLNLELLRKKKGWSKSELGRKSGIQSGTIGWIEQGRFKPYDAQLKKIADALGVEEPDYLMEDTNDE